MRGNFYILFVEKSSVNCHEAVQLTSALFAIHVTRPCMRPSTSFEKYCYHSHGKVYAHQAILKDAVRKKLEWPSAINTYKKAAIKYRDFASMSNSPTSDAQAIAAADGGAMRRK